MMMIKEAKQFIGKYVQVTLPGDPFFGGRVLRWGTLIKIEGGVAYFDDFHDCAGIHEEDHYTVADIIGMVVKYRGPTIREASGMDMT